MPTARALAKAQEDGYDLIEVAPNAVPPVARLGDFGKFRYAEQQKLKEAKKKQRAVIWKEIRMAPKIDDHDIETKLKAAIRFLDEGDKLKVTVRFRGRELAHPDRGRTLLLALGERLKEHGTIERMPLLEGRQMIMILNPVRREGQPTAPAPARPATVPAAVPSPATAARPAPTAAPATARPAATTAARPPIVRTRRPA